MNSSTEKGIVSYMKKHKDKFKVVTATEDFNVNMQYAFIIDICGKYVSTKDNIFFPCKTFNMECPLIPHASKKSDIVFLKGTTYKILYCNNRTLFRNIQYTPLYFGKISYNKGYVKIHKSSS